MPKRTLFTNITPLPPHISREIAVSMLHDHDEMIELNPLVIEHHPIKAPRYAPADEFLACAWQEMTDRIHYLPGGKVKGKVSYKACFYNLPNGLQTHTYAPMGLDIREKWTIGGTLPGELPETRELGVNTPPTGLYLREDCDMKCSIMLTNYVRKNLDNSHKTLVIRILQRAKEVEDYLQRSPSVLDESTTGFTVSRPRSHKSTSPAVSSPEQDWYPSPDASPIHGLFVDSSIHPAFRNDPDFLENLRAGNTSVLPSYQSLHGNQNGYPQDIKQSPYHEETVPKVSHPYRQLSLPTKLSSPEIKTFIAELPGSAPPLKTQSYSDSQIRRASISESSVVDTARARVSICQIEIPDEERSRPVSEPTASPTRSESSGSWANGRRVLDFTSDEYIEPVASSRHSRSFEQIHSQPVELA